MVKLTGPLHSVEARGRLGALEYNTWRGISIVKAHVDPIPPTSVDQLAQQARFKALCLTWASLTDAQRAQWRAWADLHPRSDWTGKLVRMTGFNAYVSCNSWRSFKGLSLRTNPYPRGILPSINLIYIFRPSGTWKIGWTTNGSWSWGTYDALMRVAGPYGAGQTPDFRHAVYCVDPDITESPWTISGPKFPTIGYYGVWMQPILISEGHRGSWTYARIQITA